MIVTPIPSARHETAPRSAGGARISGPGLVLFFVCLAIAGVLSGILGHPAPMIAGFLAGFYFLFSIRVADQWEKVAVLRFGRYRGLRGPGLFHIVPVVDTMSRYVDQRVRVSDVSAESALTRDTVPVNVDAIVFWMVWNAEKSILEVQDFQQAIELSAQTALRESIGRHELAQMIADRETLGRELQRILDEKTNPWQARNILGQAETEIADKFSQASNTYQNNPVALHLRAMNMLYEAIKERGSMVIVPSSAVETMGLGGNLAMATLGGAKVNGAKPAEAAAPGA
jgi:regulator of protease activity HflC (stomatin/prohibitin superfamily)